MKYRLSTLSLLPARTKQTTSCSLFPRSPFIPYNIPRFAIFLHKDENLFQTISFNISLINHIPYVNLVV
jgi:hypothetical protein